MTLIFASRERIPLSGTLKQKFIDVEGNVFFWNIHINRVIGEGRSCLCYDVEVEKGPSNCQRMIMKQFYPEPGSNEISVNLSGATMAISHMDKRPDIMELANQFEEAFALQNKLSSEIDQVVKPSVNYFDGATKLVLYEANSGESLDKFMNQNPNNLLEMLDMLVESAQALHAVHESGYLHMDIKPENILWNSKSQTVKLFDFDSAIFMKDKTKEFMIQHDGREERKNTLAPELRTFENKSIFLEPKVDVYSLGCILFEYLMGRCPSDEECLNPQKFKDEFHERIYDIYEETFDFDVQEEIFHMLKNCISYRVDRRYETAKEMADAIRIIGAGIKSKQKRRTKTADNNILSGYVLDEFPVCVYKQNVQEQSVIDVTIVGTLPIRDAFLKNIYSCAQMMDTELNIRMVMPDAADYVKNLVEHCPQLEGTTNLFLNGKPYQRTPLNHEITETAFANLYFCEDDWEQLNLESSYYLLVNKKIGQNRIWAEELEKHFREQNKKVFIGYGKRGNGGLEVLTDITSTNPLVHVQAFCCDSNMTQREKLFKTEIYRKALEIHTFYTKQWDEKAGKKEIEKDLFSKDSEGDFYNLNSSIRCALAIKYKYYAAGISKNKDDAKVMYEYVLAESSRKLFQKLTYLEHRSWTCFMIMQGFRRPTEEELREYFYRDGNDHRNKKKKLHPCICASNLEPKKLLENLSFSQWNDEKTLQDTDYDELDRLSLKLHRMAEERVKRINFRGDFQTLHLKLRDAKVDNDILQRVENLEKIAERMLSGESEINGVWKRAYSHLKKMLSQLDVQDASDILEKINYEMKVVIERNLFHDYKSSDGTIIEAIPKIMMKREDVYRRIYKTPTKNIGDLIISTLLLEPEELILLCESEEDFDDTRKNVITEFLESRGLGTIQVSYDLLDKIKSGKTSKKMVLDVTGCNEKLMMKLLSKGYLNDLPIIRCEDGKLIPEGNADEVRYYTQPRHLTVEEMLQLSNAKITQEKDLADMMAYSHIYQELWKSYLEISDETLWSETVDCLKREDEKNYLKLEKTGKTCHQESKTVFTFLLDVSGLKSVLRKLAQRGFLQSYQLPPTQLMEGKIQLTGDEGVILTINQLIDILKADVSSRFRIAEKSGAPYVYVETLGISMGENPVLESLHMNGNVEGQDYLLQKSGDGWKYANQAIKECVLKKNRILEVFAYHALLQKAHLDDIKANVRFDFHEISLVAAKGLQTLFIICTQEADKDLLTEIRYYADYFGMNGKAIILSSQKEIPEELKQRSKAMDVHLLGREYLQGDKTLAAAIDNI